MIVLHYKAIEVKVTCCETTDVAVSVFRCLVFCKLAFESHLVYEERVTHIKVNSWEQLFRALMSPVENIQECMQLVHGSQNSYKVSWVPVSEYHTRNHTKKYFTPPPPLHHIHAQKNAKLYHLKGGH